MLSMIRGNNLMDESTFSVTPIEGALAIALLNGGQNSGFANFTSAATFYLRALGCAEFPRDSAGSPPLFLARRLTRKPEWEYDLHGHNLELAIPAGEGAFDESAAEGQAVTSTYRSGINIKFGKPFDSFLGQTTKRVGNVTADWSKGAMVFDFPSFVPTTGDHHRNEEWYTKLAAKLINEFPVRPHWTKNTRQTFGQALKNLDQDVRLRAFLSFRNQ
ncbi:hypothetical protein R3P38DRAFT_3174131 [Favolaschia claudopus]|uniref:Uncharacterized protein n=1 Tax=Favolaschia claudopus TaxID=2862362 RepID=A0AAW0DJE7_9AGAR